MDGEVASPQNARMDSLDSLDRWLRLGIISEGVTDASDGESRSYLGGFNEQLRRTINHSVYRRRFGASACPLIRLSTFRHARSRRGWVNANVKSGIYSRFGG